MAEPLYVERERFPVPMVCPKCKQVGLAVWEEAALPNPAGLWPTLISLPEGFYHRVQNNNSAEPEIVCGKCGAVQPD